MPDQFKPIHRQKSDIVRIAQGAAPARAYCSAVAHRRFVKGYTGLVAGSQERGVEQDAIDSGQLVR
jgi:hypothetical protein